MIPQAIELLGRAEKSLRTADHMIYITYPLIKENRLLRSVLEQLYGIADSIIKASLYYEHAYKRIQSPPTELWAQNFEVFRGCSGSFALTDAELQPLQELFELAAKHKASSTEFIRKDRLVFMSSNARTESVSLEQLKGYLNMLKVVLQKTKNRVCEPLIDKYK